MAELKPCNVISKLNKCECNNSRSKLCIIHSIGYNVACIACRKSTKIYETEQQAIDAWNKKELRDVFL